MEHEKIKIHLFKSSVSSFLELLERENIEYLKRDMPEGVVMASTAETILILGGVAVITKHLSPIVVEWIKAKANRKVILQTKDKEIFHLEGYSLDEVKKLLTKAENLTMIDTNKDLD